MVPEKGEAMKFAIELAERGLLFSLYFSCS